MLETVQTASEKWMALWQKMKAKQPTVHQCIKVLELYGLPDEVCFDVCAYLDETSDWEELAAMIECFLAVAQRKRSQARGEQLKQWFGKIKSMLAKKKFTQDDRRRLWMQFLWCAELQYAERAWEWFENQKHGMKLALGSLVYEMEKIMRVNPNIGVQILRRMLFGEQQSTKRNLSILSRVRRCALKTEMRDEAIQLILDHVKDFDASSLACELYEIFKEIPEWRGGVWLCIKENDIKDRTLLIRLVTVDSLVRSLVWEMLKKHHGEDIDAMYEVMEAMLIAHGGDLRPIATEAWDRIKNQLPAHALSTVADLHPCLRTEAIEQIVSRPFQIEWGMRILQATPVRELKVALIKALVARDIPDRLMREIRDRHQDIVAECMIEFSETFEDMYKSMVHLSRASW